jgi:hypothetical protein
MTYLKILFMVFPATIGGTIGTIKGINNEIKTLRRHNFRVLPDIFQISARISVSIGIGAINGLLWPIHLGIASYNFIDEQSKLG